MKQKYLMRAGAFVLTAAMLAGCGGQAATNTQPPEESKTESAIESSQADLQETDSEAVAETDSEAVAETDSDAEAAAETGSEENAQATGNPKGGYPWIDSQIPENVTEGMETSLKDDYYLYTNYDWIMGGGDSKEAPNSQKKNKEQLLDILENEDDSDIHETKLIRDYYNAYIDWDEKNKMGFELLRAVVEDIESISSIEEMSAFISDGDRSRDVDVPIKVNNIFDPNDSTKYCSVLNFSGFSDLLVDNPDEYTDETEHGAEVKQAITDELVYGLESLGWTTENATKAAEDTFALEAMLCEGLYSIEDLLMHNIEQKYDFVEKSELKEWMKDFPIEGFLESRGFGKAEKLLYDNEGYIKLLGELYNKDNLELFKHYMISKYLLKFDYACDKKAVELMVKKNNVISGGSSEDIHDDFDVANYYMDQYLANARDKAYLARHDVSRQREIVIELFNNLKSTYQDMMLENDWLSDESRANMIEKIDAMNIYALYPDNWVNYDGLNFEGKPFAEIAIELEHFKQDQEKKYVESKVDNEIEAWKNWNIFLSNAKMIRELNSFMITFEAMNEMNFDLNNISKEELYASVGHMIGHEMSHGFDEYGVTFDKNGQSGDLLTEEDTAVFNERLDKIKRYYDGITVFEGYNCSGDALSTEATADITGMEVLVKMAEKEENFDFDKFFTAFAQYNKFISSYKGDLNSLKTDPHPLFYLRVNTVLQQQDKFHEFYDIQEGDGMYLAPEDRVLLW